jgi:hypothetical protein
MPVNKRHPATGQTTACAFSRVRPRIASRYPYRGRPAQVPALPRVSAAIPVRTRMPAG